MDPKALEAEILMEGFVPHTDEPMVENSDEQYTWYTHCESPNVQIKLSVRGKDCVIWYYRNEHAYAPAFEYGMFPGNKRKHEQVTDSDSSTASETDNEDMLASANDTVAPSTPTAE